MGASPSGTTRTARSAWCRRLDEVEPSTVRATAPCRRVPQTTTSAPRSSAAARMRFHGWSSPGASAGSAARPAASASRTPSAAVASAFARSSRSSSPRLCWTTSGDISPPPARMTVARPTAGSWMVSTVARAPGNSAPAERTAACAAAEPSKAMRTWSAMDQPVCRSPPLPDRQGALAVSDPPSRPSSSAPGRRTGSAPSTARSRRSRSSARTASARTCTTEPRGQRAVTRSAKLATSAIVSSCSSSLKTSWRAPSSTRSSLSGPATRSTTGRARSTGTSWSSAPWT